MDFEAPGLKEVSQFREPCRMFWVNERSLRLRTSMPIESSFSRPRGSTLDSIRCGLEYFVGYFGIVVLVMRRQEQ